MSAQKNTVSTSEARRSFADLLGRAQYAHESFRITRKGKPVAAIVPLDDLEAMEALEDYMDIRAARESLKDAEENGGTMDAEAFFAQLDEERAEEV